MKKYAVFLISFVLLYIVLQLLSGLVLTALYNPSLSLYNSNLSQEVAFGQNSIFSLLLTLLVATLAYFVSQKLYVKAEK